MSDNETITIEQVKKERDSWKRTARRLQRELAKATYGPEYRRAIVLEDRLEERDMLLVGLKRKLKSLKFSVGYRNLQIKELREELKGKRS